MADFYECLDDRLQAFIERQPVFFIATAPADGRINLSPKGLDTLRVLDHRTVAYLDLTGSGNETAAHLAADGRATLMFCNFHRKPMIMRLYGHGRIVRHGSDEWEALIGRFELLPGARQLIVIDIASAMTSCGYAVPLMELVAERPTLRKWTEHQGEAGLRDYREQYNRHSIDGLPAPALEPES